MGRNGFGKDVAMFGNGEEIKVRERRAKEKKKQVDDNKSRIKCLKD